MKRREFISKSLCFGCVGALCSGAYLLNKNRIYDFYRSKESPFYLSSKNLPDKVTIDLSTICTLQCPECWLRLITEEDKLKPTYGYLKFEDFKNFIDKNKTIKQLSLNSSGEMFTNPDFDKIIAYAFSKNISMFACGGAHLNYLSDETAENLVKYEIKKLTVSIDGATPETYSIYRIGGDFNKVIENVKKINKFKEKYNSPYPELFYKFIVFGHNEHEVQAAKDLAAELNMTIEFTSNFAPNYSPLKNPEKVKQETGVVPANIEHDYIRYKNGHDWFYCMALKEAPHINIIGELFPCCFVTDGFNRHLNVFKDGLYNVLNSPDVYNIKETLSDFSKPPSDKICAKCPVFIYLRDLNEPLKFV